MVRVKIREYLDQIRADEKKKPREQRKKIPNQSEMARAFGTHRQTISSFLSRDNHQRLDLELLDSIISQLRANGHDVQITDIFEYVED